MDGIRDAFLSREEPGATSATTQLDRLLDESQRVTRELVKALRTHTDEARIRALHERLERVHRAWTEEAWRGAHAPGPSANTPRRDWC